MKGDGCGVGDVDVDVDIKEEEGVVVEETTEIRQIGPKNALTNSWKRVNAKVINGEDKIGDEGTDEEVEEADEDEDAEEFEFTNEAAFKAVNSISKSNEFAKLIKYLTYVYSHLL